MNVIPLTLTISLFLSITFIALFLREFTRPRRAGAEYDSLLPFEADLPSSSTAALHKCNQNKDTSRINDEHDHPAGDVCSQGKSGVACCTSCRRRRERQQQQAVAPDTGFTVKKNDRV